MTIIKISKLLLLRFDYQNTHEFSSKYYNILKYYKNHAQNNFKDIFLAVEIIADKFNMTLIIPRFIKN